jgi:hypothetical protein
MRPELSAESPRRSGGLGAGSADTTAARHQRAFGGVQRPDDLRGHARERSEGACARLVHLSLNARRDVGAAPAPRQRGTAPPPRRPTSTGQRRRSPHHLRGADRVRLLTVGVGRPPQRDPAAARLPCPEVHLAETSAPALPPGWATPARRDLLPTRTVRPTPLATCPLDRHRRRSAPTRHSGPGRDSHVPQPPAGGGLRLRAPP